MGRLLSEAERRREGAYAPTPARHLDERERGTAAASILVIFVLLHT